MWALLIVPAAGVVVAMVVVDYRRAQARRRLTRAAREAVKAKNWPLAVESYRGLFELVHETREVQQLRMALSYAQRRAGRADLALAELRAVDGVFLHPVPKAQWKNALAYALAETRSDEALALLDEADTLLDGIGQRRGTLAACILGTRGIVRLHRGELEAAERNLEAAIALQPDDAQRPELDAERWWWLAEIAQKTGRSDEARLRLEHAAALFSTEFGRRAARALGRPG